MKIKQFLKPDKRKIALYAILLFLTFLYVMFFWPTYFCPTHPIPIPPGISPDNYRPPPSYSLPWEICSYHEGEPDAITAVMITFYPLLVLLGIFIMPYLISCLIVWIYDKMKKKK